MKHWMRRWFPVTWPDRQLRLRVAAEYSTIGKHALADIALRNFLFEPFPDGSDFAVHEGRRRAALEIFQMCRVDPQSIADISVKLGGTNAA